MSIAIVVHEILTSKNGTDNKNPSGAKDGQYFKRP